MEVPGRRPRGRPKTRYVDSHTGQSVVGEEDADDEGKLREMICCGDL